MDAGRLDRRITLQRRGADTDDGFATRPGAWSDLATVWAQRIPLSGAERAVAAETASFTTARYRIRKDSAWADLSAQDAIFDGAQLDIKSVSEPDRGWLVIEAAARGD